MSGHNLVLIEANADLYKELEVAISPYPNIIGIQAKVLFSGGLGGGWREGTLSEILQAQGIDPQSVDVVSIDIDGDDAAVFENLGFVPEIVVCEFNPTFPSDAVFRNPPRKEYRQQPT
jgi:hypothetical protein